MRKITLYLTCLCAPFLVHADVSAVTELQLNRESREIDRMKPHPVSYAPIVDQASESVVSVYTANIVEVPRGGYQSPHDLFMRRFFGLPMPPQPSPQDEDVEERRMPQGIGSGVIVTPDGYIITNNHVVTDRRGETADEILVSLNDGRELVAQVVGRDPGTDVAVLKVEAEGLPAVRIADSDQTRVGDVSFAIGNPLGVGLTVTKGIISAKGRQIGIYGDKGYESFLQTDASINPGNSGGALIDIEGRLVGINSAILSRSGGNIGIGFAIPSNLAVSVMESLLEYGEVRRGFLGVNISDLTPDKAEVFGYQGTDGVLVDRVETGFPAAEAGIERGDIIMSVQGAPVRNVNQLRLLIAQNRPGTMIELKLFRDGQIIEKKATLGDLEKLSAQTGDMLFEGVRGAVLSDASRQEYGLPEQLGGVLVAEVDSSSKFARHLRPGMVILEVNKERVSRPEEVRSLLHKGANSLYVYDGGRYRYLIARIN